VESVSSTWWNAELAAQIRIDYLSSPRGRSMILGVRLSYPWARDRPSHAIGASLDKMKKSISRRIRVPRLVSRYIVYFDGAETM
jgi:hypothetical protein